MVNARVNVRSHPYFTFSSSRIPIEPPVSLKGPSN